MEIVFFSGIDCILGEIPKWIPFLLTKNVDLRRGPRNASLRTIVLPLQKKIGDIGSD